MRSPDEAPENEAATLVRAPAEAAVSPKQDAVPSLDSFGAAGTVIQKPGRPRRFEDTSGRPPVPLSVPDMAARPVAAASFDQRYEARSLLGVGGMGEVRLCKDKLIGREVALKVIRPEVGAHDGAQDRFVREARVQGQLEHPAIAPVYDLGVDAGGGVFFTMKRVRGWTLDAVLDALAYGDAAVAQKYSRRRLLTAFSSVCLAVDFAHARGVLHRDLKPSNIILGDFGEVYVLDWGLAKVAGVADAGELVLPPDGAARTLVGSLIGTPGYMAPEQARGDIDGLDARSDVYALGAILFEILALGPLHPLASIEVAIASTLRGADARPSARAGAETPPELEAVCVRATALDPAARFPSARALSDAIERFLDGDRNLGLRRDLAAAHVEAAREALQRSARGGGSGEGSRAARVDALREVGSAIALDPRNAEALATMARLLTDVPDEVPREAEAELEASAAAARKSAARTGASRYLFWSAITPVAMLMGIRRWPLAMTVISAVVTCGLLAFWLSRRRTVDVRHGLALLVASSTTIALMSAIFGPFILVPGQAATNTMFFALIAEPRGRRVVILLGVIAVCLPFALELMGLVPPAYTFHDGLLQVMPRATELPALPATVTLLATSVALVIIPGVMAGRMRDALAAAERRLFLQAWHLWQLVPNEARGARAEVPGSRRVGRA